MKSCLLDFVCLFWAILLFAGCARQIDPAVADREVRALLGNAPGFDWEVNSTSRLAAPSGTQFPFSPKDDPDARRVTERIQRKGLMKMGIKASSLSGMNGERIYLFWKMGTSCWIWKPP